METALEPHESHVRQTYNRGFSDALEFVLELFNRISQNGLSCEGLTEPTDMENHKQLMIIFLEEVAKLNLLVKGKKFEEIEKSYGYCLSEVSLGKLTHEERQVKTTA